MFPRPDSIRPMLMSVSVKTCFWERLRAWRSSRSCATTPRTTGSLYRSFLRRMVQRYVKFGNFRSPVAASFAALQKVRSAPPVTGLLLPAVRRLLFAAYSPPASTVRRPPFAACCLCLLFAARCSLPATLRPPSTVRLHGPPPRSAARRSPFAACCLCLLFAARRLPFAARCLSPATTVRHPLFAARPLPPATTARRPPLVIRYSPPATLRPLLSARHRCPLLSVCRHSPPSQFAARKQPPRGSTPLRQTCFCPDMR